VKLKSILKTSLTGLSVAALSTALIAPGVLNAAAAGMGGGRGGLGVGRGFSGPAAPVSPGMPSRSGSGMPRSNFSGVPFNSRFPAWHAWSRFHHPFPRFIVLRPFGFPFFASGCYGSFWPYFNYGACPGAYYGFAPYPFYGYPPMGSVTYNYVSPDSFGAINQTRDADSIVTSTAPANNFVQMAEAALRARDYLAAVRAWRHAVVDDPNNGTIVMMLAQTLFAAGIYDEAAAAAQQALTLLPEDQWRDSLERFRANFINPQDYADQLKKLGQAVKQYPTDPALRFEFGLQQAYSGNPDAALNELDKLLELVPQDQIVRKLRDQVVKQKETVKKQAAYQSNF
jgi:Tetratricopeptide repeat